MSATPLTACPVCGTRRFTFRRGPCRKCAGGYCGAGQVHDDPAREDADARPYPPRPLPCQPTDTEPGTAARVDVLMGRAARGESLWHPADRRHCEGMVGHPEHERCCPECRRPVKRAGDRCWECAHKPGHAPIPPIPLSPPEDTPVSETNGTTHTTDAPDAPARRPHTRGMRERVEALCREIGPTVTRIQVNARLAAEGLGPCGGATYSAARLAAHGPGKSGPRRAVRTPAPPAADSAPTDSAPRPAPPAPVVPAQAPPGDDLVDLVDDVIRLVERLGAERLTRLVGVIARRGGAS